MPVKYIIWRASFKFLVKDNKSDEIGWETKVEQEVSKTEEENKMVQRWEGVIVKEKFLKMPANNKKSDACSGWLLDFIQENGKDIAGVQRTGNSMGKWERNIDVVVGGFEEKIYGNGFDILLLILFEQKKHVLIVFGW